MVQRGFRTNGDTSKSDIPAAWSFASGPGLTSGLAGTSGQGLAASKLSMRCRRHKRSHAGGGTHGSLRENPYEFTAQRGIGGSIDLRADLFEHGQKTNTSIERLKGVPVGSSPSLTAPLPLRASNVWIALAELRTVRGAPGSA
jgi:hypothetical protein